MLKRKFLIGAVLAAGMITELPNVMAGCGHEGWASWVAQSGMAEIFGMKDTAGRAVSLTEEAFSQEKIERIIYTDYACDEGQRWVDFLVIAKASYKEDGKGNDCINCALLGKIDTKMFESAIAERNALLEGISV